MSTDITRSITETVRLIEETDRRIVAARKRKEASEVLTLQRERRFLIDRKLSLQKMHASEVSR